MTRIEITGKFDDSISVDRERTLISVEANVNYERGFLQGGLAVGVFYETSFRMAYRHHKQTAQLRSKFDFIAVTTTSEEGYRRVRKKRLSGGGYHHYYIMLSPSYGEEFDVVNL